MDFCQAEIAATSSVITRRRTGTAGLRVDFISHRRPTQVLYRNTRPEVTDGETEGDEEDQSFTLHPVAPTLLSPAHCLSLPRSPPGN